MRVGKADAWEDKGGRDGGQEHLSVDLHPPPTRASRQSGSYLRLGRLGHHSTPISPLHCLL